MNCEYDDEQQIITLYQYPIIVVISDVLGGIKNDVFPFSSAVPDKLLCPAYLDLKRAQIIPTVLNDFAPSCTLSVIYPAHHVSVHYGNTLKPSYVDAAPAVHVDCGGGTTEWDAANFSVALTDPDAPSRKKPKWSEMCHWIAVGGRADGEQGSLVDYKPPGPPPGTGKHRYVFVLLKGDTSSLTEPSDRQHWGFGKPGGKKGRKTHGVQDWADREGLEIVGANWFEAEHES
ncbi:MAG: hypothetical protein M1818_000748 [Claussenomyces sp. TS43310]|nr:MAG: hypothetical protein M1818_000748 [Claussenomyces sp. TS43310]